MSLHIELNNEGFEMIDPQRVPEPLRYLIPLAERFGVADDRARETVVSSLSVAEAEKLKREIETEDELLDGWLAGPEAAGPHFSDEYIAFSAMRMAADLVQPFNRLLHRTTSGGR